MGFANILVPSLIGFVAFSFKIRPELSASSSPHSRSLSPGTPRNLRPENPKNSKKLKSPEQEDS